MTRSLIVAEGTAETAILEILLENDCLTVTPDDLISDEWVVPRLLKGQLLAEKYLQRDFGAGIDLLVVLDSLNREISVPYLYKRQIHQTKYFVTRPEIEAIQLYAETDWLKKYQNYRRRHHGEEPKNLKPSAFFKASPTIGGLGIKEVKTDNFVRQLWAHRADRLVKAILHVENDMRTLSLGQRQPLAGLLRPHLRY
ncbi:MULTISPECIES: hypothetical protein [Lacticaseibacillus]|uniref:hypothetical protein n=1 Tax=Lacticaseibacillus TaxID=2759736 RepID=UPI00063DAC0C|nr:MULTISPECIES: hypothetical protein [Lacticaseibacillus]KLI75604.1 hypothetical protein AAW28_08890 [Lacticaseibacillus casei]